MSGIYFILKFRISLEMHTSRVCLQSSVQMKHATDISANNSSSECVLTATRVWRICLHLGETTKNVVCASVCVFPSLRCCLQSPDCSLVQVALRWQERLGGARRKRSWAQLPGIKQWPLHNERWRQHFPLTRFHTVTRFAYSYIFPFTTPPLFSVQIIFPVSRTSAFMTLLWKKKNK